MIKIHKHILTAALIQSIGLSSLSFAEEKSISIFESLKKIQKPIEERDDFTELINNAKTMQERQNLGLDEKTAQAVNKLRNPFIPQLPQKEIPPVPVAENPLPPPPVAFTQNPLPPVEPTPPPPVPTPSGPELTVSGLVWNTTRPQAIINGQVVSVGDTVDNWIITGISKTGIEIRSGTQTLTVNKESVAQESNDNSSIEVKGDPLGQKYSTPRAPKPPRSTPKNQIESQINPSPKNMPRHP